MHGPSSSSPQLWQIAAVAGVGVGLVAYRAGGIPLGVSGDVEYIAGGSIVAIVTAATWFQQYRPTEPPERRAPAIAAGLATALVVAACAFLLAPPRGYLWLARRELPGMTLALPRGGAVEGDYDLGTIKADVAEDTVLRVSWQIGDVPDEEGAAAIAQASVAGAAKKGVRFRLVGNRAFQLAGHAARTVELASDSHRAYISLVECSGRVVEVVLVAGIEGSERLHRRVLDGFSCAPRPAHQGPPSPDVAIDRRDGWFRVPGDAGAMYWTDRRAVVALRPALLPTRNGALDERTAVESLVPSVSPGAVVGARQSRATPDGERGVWTAEGPEGDVAIAIWRCGTPARHVVGLAQAPHGQSLDEAIDLMLTGRCLDPGEAPPEYPELPADAP